MTASLCLRAYAKVNLALRVGPLRPDGYHEIATVLQTISLHDTIEFAPRARGFTLVVRGPEAAAVPRGASNLVLRAARALADELGESRGAAIRLTKRVPHGAGLGGGSSDAAATLRGLLRLWSRRPGGERLGVIAAGLGSDVPFFLRGGLALATGRGERIAPLPPPPRPLRLILLVPPVRVSTAWAYGRYPIPKSRLTAWRRICTLFQLEWKRGLRQKRNSQFLNDLEEVILPPHPVIAQAKKRLSSRGVRVALMSGSGSAVFGLLTPGVTPEAIAARLSYNPYKVFLARSVRAGSRPCR